MADDLQQAAKRVSRAIERARYKPRIFVPILTADPDPEDGITLYLDPNGNLRSMVEGTIYQYSKTTVTAASGSFASDPQPELFEKTYAAVWARAFCDLHGAEDTTFPGYGDDPANTHGYRRIMIGLPDATIRADTAGATIDAVTLTFTNTDAFAEQVTLHVGWHAQTATPASYTATRADTVLIDAPKVGVVSQQVDETFGTALRDDLYRGLTIEQPPGNINAGTIDWAATSITIAYTV